MNKCWTDIVKTGKIRVFLTWAAVIVLILSLLPVSALAGVDRASADDWSFGTLTHLAWMDSHSVFQVLRAAFASVKKYYYAWQGTWFSVFLFSLQPEVFSHEAYCIVPYLTTGVLIAGVSCFLYNLLVRLLHVSRRDFLLLDAVLLLTMIQFVPYKTSAIFWYNGAVHYTVPFALALAACGSFLHCVADFRKRDVVFSTVFMTLLGGTNYLAAILGLTLFFLFGVLFYKRERRVLWMLVPLSLETVGLLISALAPGNALRGGDDYQITAGRMIQAVFDSFAQGAAGMLHTVVSHPTAMAAMIVTAVLLWDILRGTVPDSGISFPCPGLVILDFWCVYCAMYWPIVFVGGSVDDGSVSVGVPNTFFWVFILALFSSLLYGMGWLVKKKKAGGEGLLIPLYAAGFGAAFLLLFVCRLDLKNSTDYACYYYIRTGRAAVYKEQMDEFTELVTREDVEDVVVPFIVGEQEPLVHLPLTLDKDDFINQKMAAFFGKKSMVAIPRDEWDRQHEIR